MKTLQTIKNEVAKEEGYKDFDDAFYKCDMFFEKEWDEVSKRYAAEVAVSFGKSLSNYEHENHCSIAFDKEERTIEDFFEIFKNKQK